MRILGLAFALFIFLVVPFSTFASTSDGTIDSVDKFAWSENNGWINFNATGNVHVTDTQLTGYAWNEHTGWINLQPPTSGVTNDGNGHLAGYAWGEGMGWINFSGVTIDSLGYFYGYAQSDTGGQISFNCLNTNTCSSGDFRTRTDWRPINARASTGGGGGGVGSSSYTLGTASTSSPSPSLLIASAKAIINNTLATKPTTSANNSYIPKACSPYLTSFISLKSKNNADDVKKLQTFLNTYEKESLAVDGVFKESDQVAVSRFQQKYSDILAFWKLKKPTGYVYIATQKAINEIYCEDVNKFTCPYFTEYLDEGNVSAEVLKIKSFLNVIEGESLDLSSSTYDADLVSAVKRFQTKHKAQVLTPWNSKTATGSWYKSTKKRANDILGCFAPVRLDNGTVLQ